MNYKKNRPILNDNLGDEFGAFLYDACVNILTVTKGAVYICMSSSELDTLQKAFREAGGKWSTFVIWAKNTFTLGRCGLSAPVRADPLRLEGRRRSLLVRRPRPGRCLVLRQAAQERSAPDDEAGGAGRAGDPQLVEEPRHRARSVRRLGHDDDRGGTDRAAGAADRARSQVRRCDRSALAGGDWWQCLQCFDRPEIPMHLIWPKGSKGRRARRTIVNDDLPPAVPGDGMPLATGSVHRGTIPACLWASP